MCNPGTGIPVLLREFGQIVSRIQFGSGPTTLLYSTQGTHSDTGIQAYQGRGITDSKGFKKLIQPNYTYRYVPLCTECGPVLRHLYYEIFKKKSHCPHSYNHNNQRQRTIILVCRKNRENAEGTHFTTITMRQ